MRDEGDARGDLCVSFVLPAWRQRGETVWPRSSSLTFCLTRITVYKMSTSEPRKDNICSENLPKGVHEDCSKRNL